jgi:HSP90 family molecular chaperone
MIYLNLKKKLKNFKLYIRHAFITNNCEKFISEYLNFLKRIIDLDNFTLTIFREQCREEGRLKNII